MERLPVVVEQSKLQSIAEEMRHRAYVGEIELSHDDELALLALLHAKHWSECCPDPEFDEPIERWYREAREGMANLGWTALLAQSQLVAVLRKWLRSINPEMVPETNASRFAAQALCSIRQRRLTREKCRYWFEDIMSAFPSLGPVRAELVKELDIYE